MTEKKISVIIPAYNCAGYIDKTIECVLNQTYPNVEAVVVNDGSPDNLSEVLKKYADNDKITIIEKSNGGASSARNAGLDAAAGDLIFFLDADDRIENDVLERAVCLMDESGADIVKLNLIRVYPDGKRMENYRVSDARTVIKKDEYPKLIYEAMMDGIGYNSPACLYKREVIGDARFREDMITCEDAMFNLEVLTRSQALAFDPEIMYLYMQDTGGLTSAGLSITKKISCNNEFAKAILKKLPEWGMDTAYYRRKTRLRMLRITFGKVFRRLKRK